MDQITPTTFTVPFSQVLGTRTVPRGGAADANASVDRLADSLAAFPVAWQSAGGALTVTAKVLEAPLGALSPRH